MSTGPLTPHAAERRSVASLVPYARNARTHSDAQVAQLAGSIREFGFTNPVICDEDGTIIAGHGRVMAAKQLGLQDVPCIVVAGWSEAKKRAYCIADNKLPMNAEWDMAMLSAELQELDTGAFDMSLLGFGEGELEAIMTWNAGVASGLTDPDEVPPVEVHPVSRPGDVWILDRHRLACGDCTMPGTVRAVLGDVRPHLMVTDPPYGVKYDPEWRNEALGEGNRSTGTVANDDLPDWREAWKLFPGDVAYVWTSDRFAGDSFLSLRAAGFVVRSQIVWAKQHFAISRGHYHPQHETCWYAVRKGATGHWAGDRKQSTLWQISNGLSQGGPRAEEDKLTGHGTQKPVACMRRPIENNSNPGQAVYEPFNGSGSTIIACEQSGRACYAIEIDPLYIDVAVKRWQNFTGKKATLDGDGRTFEELSNARAQAEADVA